MNTSRILVAAMLTLLMSACAQTPKDAEEHVSDPTPTAHDPITTAEDTQASETSHTIELPLVADCEDLNPHLEAIVESEGCPALAALVIKDGKIVAQGAAGERKLGSGVSVTMEDKWHLGSCTKAMTASLAARYVERGTIRWDSTLDKLFPEHAASMNQAWKSVTIDMLLAHRGGTYAKLGAHRELWGPLWSLEADPMERRAWLAGEMLKREPEFEPGTRFAYSNAGYMLLGAGLEALTGKSWESLMREELFDPLGMTSAGFGFQASVGKIDQPWSHRSGDSLTPVEPGLRADNPRALGPAGTVHASLADWAKFIQLHMDGLMGSSEYLSQSTFQKLHTPFEGQKYALGWLEFQRPWAGGTAINHAGSNTMNYCVVWAAPAKNTAFLVATNCGDARAPKVCEMVLGKVVGKYAR